MSRFRGIVILLVFVWFPAAAAAQTGTGTVEGRVRDSSGAAIPGAIVRVVNEAGTAPAQVVSDADGAYRAVALPPGRYSVAITLNGFESVARHVDVAADQTATIDA